MKKNKSSSCENISLVFNVNKLCIIDGNVNEYKVNENKIT